MRRRLEMLGIAAAVGALAACSASAASPGSAYASPATAAATLRAGAVSLPAAVTRAPATADSVLADAAPGALTAAFARVLFASAPVVVVSATAGAGGPGSRGGRQRRARAATARLPAHRQVPGPAGRLGPGVPPGRGADRGAARGLAGQAGGGAAWREGGREARVPARDARPGAAQPARRPGPGHRRRRVGHVVSVDRGRHRHGAVGRRGRGRRDGHRPAHGPGGDHRAGPAAAGQGRRRRRPVRPR